MEPKVVKIVQDSSQIPDLRYLGFCQQEEFLYRISCLHDGQTVEWVREEKKFIIGYEGDRGWGYRHLYLQDVLGDGDWEFWDASEVDSELVGYFFRPDKWVEVSWAPEIKFDIQVLTDEEAAKI